MGVLRLYLALAVIDWHFHFMPQRTFVFSFAAVLCFFVLSGFYMALVITEAYGNSPAGIRNFYLNRMLRLYPIYWVVLFVIAGAHAHGLVPHGVAGLNGYGGVWSADRVASLIDQVSVLPQVLWRNLTGNTDPPSNGLSIGLYYTVGLEMMFYVLAPFLVLRHVSILVGLFTAAVVLHFLPHALDLPMRQWQYEFFPSTLMLFFAGVLAYRLYHVARHWSFPRWLGWLVLPVLIAYGIFIARENLYTNDWRPLALYVFVALGTPFLFIASNGSKLDKLCGDLSYPLYVVQGLAIALVGTSIIGPADLKWWGVATALIMAAFLHFAIEYPLDRWRKRLRSIERNGTKVAPLPA